MQTCIITGCSKGIGCDMVKRFAESGYRVVGLDISEPDVANHCCQFIRCDIRKIQDIISAFYEINERYGACHALVNNAGVTKFNKGICDVNESDYLNVIDTNLKGAYFCAKEFIKLNKGQDYGRIINIASTRFHQNEKDWELYGMSKGGIVSMTNSLCVSLQGTPITVNCISPGYIKTEDYEGLDQSEHDIHPSNRVGRPQDISNVCLFLAEKDNDFINGANIIVDGGVTKRMIY